MKEKNLKDGERDTGISRSSSYWGGGSRSKGKEVKAIEGEGREGGKKEKEKEEDDDVRQAIFCFSSGRVCPVVPYFFEGLGSIGKLSCIATVISRSDGHGDRQEFERGVVFLFAQNPPSFPFFFSSLVFFFFLFLSKMGGGSHSCSDDIGPAVATGIATGPDFFFNFCQRLRRKKNENFGNIWLSQDLAP